MIGKKINQLATELAPVSTDLTIIGDPTTGVSKKITLAQLGAIFSGAVSFYTNLAAFPNPGTIDVIYCAKDTKKLYLWSGSAYIEVFPSQALLDTYQLRSEKGVSNGYASLDSGGKVPISQLPSSIMEYKGTWNAATNTPTLANGTGDTGDVYLCNVAGTVNFGAGPITFAVGDYVIYSGSIWQRSSGAVGTVTSVAASITGDAIGITGSPITTSGTLALAFAGNSTQYVNGAGNLVTFPGIINEAQNLITEVYNKTGATLTKGTVVYINGGQGNLPSVTKALATGDSTSAQTYGIVRNDITNNNNGYVVVAGRISDLDTQAFTEGTQLYLSPTTAGTYTSTKPYAPQHLVYVGIVVRAHPTQGVIEVKIQNGYELDELHNVSAQSPTNNDGIFYNSTTSLWEKKSIATVLGYTPQAQLNGTGFVKASGTTISYDNSTYVTIDTFENITASKNFTVGLSLGAAGGGNQVSVFANTSSLYSGSAGTNIFGFNSSNNIYFGKGSNNGGLIIWNNSTARYYTLPDADGTIALVGGSGVGSVTSVAALTIGTTGTDLSSTVANSTTTPVITLNVPTASATNRGALSSADWTTFNSKQGTITLTTTGTSGAATFSANTLNIPNYTITNAVTGTGTTNYLPKFTGTSTIGNSQIFDNGTFVGIGRTTNASAGWNLAVQNGLTVTQGTTETQLFGYFGDAGVGTYSNHNFKIRVNNTDRAIFDTSGNLGLGVTPSAWVDYKVLQLGGGSISSYTDNNFFEVNQNTFWNGVYRYVNNGFASRYQQNAGRHEWYQAGTGTAGNAISFTQAMTLNASGNLFIGTTSATFPSSGRGYVTLNGSTDTVLEFKNADTLAGYLFQNSSALQIETFGSRSLSFHTASTTRLTIASTGAATFSSSVTATSDSTLFKEGYRINATTTGGGGSQPAYTYYTAAGSKRWSHFLNVGDDKFHIANASNSELFTITQGGSFGIGTTSPSEKLHVFASAGTSAKFVLEEGGAQSVLWTTRNSSTNGDLRFQTMIGGTVATRMLIDYSGNVEINTGSIKTGEPDTGWGRAAIKIGASVSGAAFNVTRYLPVSVDGTVYYINLNSSTP